MKKYGNLFISFTVVSYILMGVSSVNAKDPKFCALNSADDFLQQSKNRAVEAETTTDLRQKSVIAKEGVFFADKCLAKSQKMVGCHYYKGVNLGLDLETRTTGIKRDLKRMIDEFEWVVAHDFTYDQGGAYRNLGYVYLKAPRLPILGKNIRRDLKKAESYALNALKVDAKDVFNLRFAGEVAFKKKEYKKAFAFFKQAIRQSKNSMMSDDDRKFLKKWAKKSKNRLKRQGNLEAL